MLRSFNSFGLRLVGTPVSRLLPTLSVPLSGGRAFHSTTTNFARSTTDSLKAIGVVEPRTESDYGAGQMFIHRIFGYMGVITTSHNTKMIESKGYLPVNQPQVSERKTMYQALIHRDDWKSMGFAKDIVACLSNNLSGVKKLKPIDGMDYVAQSDIIPFTGENCPKIDHDLVDSFFSVEMDCSGVEETRYKLRNEVLTQRIPSFSPILVNRQISDDVEVMVTTFYLGNKCSEGKPKHTWRLIVRLNSMRGDTVVLRERYFEAYSPEEAWDLCDRIHHPCHQLIDQGAYEWEPVLSSHRPAVQFAVNVEADHEKGHFIRGFFTMEKENGHTFAVHIPLIRPSTINKNVEADHNRYFPRGYFKVETEDGPTYEIRPSNIKKRDEYQMSFINAA